VKCVPCGYTGGVGSTPSGFIQASLWLVLLLVTAFLLLVALGTLICLRIQCMRNALRRRTAREAAGAAYVGATAAEVRIYIYVYVYVYIYIERDLDLDVGVDIDIDRKIDRWIGR